MRIAAGGEEKREPNLCIEHRAISHCSSLRFINRLVISSGNVLSPSFRCGSDGSRMLGLTLGLLLWAEVLHLSQQL